MSYCREEGKDKLIFVTEEDHSTPSKIVLPDEDDDEYEGLIKASGEINWDCPCLQGMAYGPCGDEFKSAFSCFHYSEADPKGSDCIPQFRDMQICFSKYPEVYGKDEEKDDVDGVEEERKELKADSAVVVSSDEEAEGLDLKVQESRSVVSASVRTEPQEGTTNKDTFAVSDANEAEDQCS